MTSHLIDSAVLMSSIEDLPLETLNEEELNLLERAKPNEYAESFFNHHLRVATALGMSWVQALDYVAEKRIENGSAVIAMLLTQMAY